MSDIIKPVTKKHYSRGQNDIRRSCIYKDAALNMIKDSTAYGSMLIESNEEYMEHLTKSDKEEYDILKLNMMKSESEPERELIRREMADMREARTMKDTENKAFYERQQQEHSDNSRKILNSIFLAVIIGSVGGVGYKYRKPILATCKSLAIKA